MKQEIIRQWQEEIDGRLYNCTEYRTDGRYPTYVSQVPAMPKEEWDAHICEVFGSVFRNKQERQRREQARKMLAEHGS